MTVNDWVGLAIAALGFSAAILVIAMAVCIVIATWKDE
jgi:hypothetical protein